MKCVLKEITRLPLLTSSSKMPVACLSVRFSLCYRALYNWEFYSWSVKEGGLTQALLSIVSIRHTLLNSLHCINPFLLQVREIKQTSNQLLWTMPPLCTIIFWHTFFITHTLQFHFHGEVPFCIFIASFIHARFTILLNISTVNS